MTKTYRLKSMSELLADGWAVTSDLAGQRRLAKEKSIGLAERHWNLLGSFINLYLTDRPGLYTKDMVQISKHMVAEEVGGTRFAIKAVKPCTCDIKSLCDVGCTCGGFAREQSARRA